MKTRLFGKFKDWDDLQGEAEESPEIREKKDAVLKEMQEILSNRTYVRNIVNDLIAATN